eukprot:SAG11_NODE_861_length_6847_cov_32.410492_4_plen_290_part_01
MDNPNSQSIGRRKLLKAPSVEHELRAKYTPQKISALKQEALNKGADEVALNDVDDSDDPREAIIALLLSLHEPTQEEPTQEEPDAAMERERLIAELTPKKMSVLKRQAMKQGAAQDKLDEIDDAEDPREAVIALLIGLWGTAHGVQDHAESKREVDATLRSELSVLKNSELKRRAAASGVNKAELSEVDDEEQPRDALIELIITAEAHRSTTDPSTQNVNAEAEAKLRSELSGLKRSALRRRALAVGVSEDDLEDAEDSDVPKQAVMDLIVLSSSASQSNAIGASEVAAE